MSGLKKSYCRWSTQRHSSSLNMTRCLAASRSKFQPFSMAIWLVFVILSQLTSSACLLIDFHWLR